MCYNIISALFFFTCEACGIFISLTGGLNLGLLHYRQNLHQRSPWLELHEPPEKPMVRVTCKKIKKGYNFKNTVGNTCTYMCMIS